MPQISVARPDTGNLRVHPSRNDRPSLEKRRRSSPPRASATRAHRRVTVIVGSFAGRRLHPTLSRNAKRFMAIFKCSYGCQEVTGSAGLWPWPALIARSRLSGHAACRSPCAAKTRQQVTEVCAVGACHDRHPGRGATADELPSALPGSRDGFVRVMWDLGSGERAFSCIRPLPG